MSRQGVSVDCFNAADGFNPRMKAVRLPSPYPPNAFNCLAAICRFGARWRSFYRRTDFAFWWMSRRARRNWAAHKVDYDGVIQSGVLFDGGLRNRSAPFALQLDHTYAISKRCPPVPGLPPAAVASSSWEAAERRTYAEADAIFTMSDYVKQSLVNDYGVADEKVLVIGAGPNLDELPVSPGLNPANRHVLFVGKDFERKGGPVLLDAFRKVRRRLPDARLTIVGPLMKGEEEGVRFAGMLPPKEMPAVYRDCSVFVLPTWREPYGISFVEAMAFGLPCIGTRIEAIPEIINEGETGYLVEPGDADGLAERLLTLLNDPALCTRLGRQGRLKVEQQLNWENVTRKMIERLKDLPSKASS
jgi:glycosyltransferase involved in cell wall biosynthesis